MKQIMKWCLALALGFAVAGCSKDSSGDEGSGSGDRGHKKVQLWKDGPYWAETNIGAENPWDYGYYFWWGDTVGYKWMTDFWRASNGSSSNFEFKDVNTPTHNKSIATLQSEGWISADRVLTPKHDAAHVHWGGKWRMPTDQELKDLIDKCDWTWKTMNGVNGYVVRGKGEYISASIFLPAAGFGSDSSFLNGSLDGPGGSYWSSVPGSDYDFYASYLYFKSSYKATRNYNRYDGHPVRPVQGFTK